MCGSTLLLYNYRERVQAMGGGYYCRWIGLPWHLGRLRTAKRLLPAERGERWMNYIVGASLMVSRSFLYDIGLLCEEYFLYFEETDWAVRAKGRYSLAYSPTSIVYHKVGASIGTSSDPRKKSLICDFYSIRNRIYFTRKFYPYALPSVYFFLLFSVGARLILGQWKRAFMILHLMATGGSFPIWPFAVWDNRVVGKNC
jgi:GT2 family glycosyltransferase